MVSPILLIAVPLILAFSVPLWGLIHKKLEKFVPLIAFGFNTYLIFRLLPFALTERTISVVIANIKPPFGINLAVGPFGLFFALIIQLVALATAFYLLSYDPPEPSDKFYMLFILLVLGSTGMVLTGDIFNLFVVLEITSISAYALTAITKTGPAAEAGFKYLLLGSLGSTLVLLGIALIYGSLGTLNMAHIAHRISGMDSRLVVAAAILFIVGFGVEAEMLPLNGWVPDAYQAAPIPVVALLSGAVAKAGLYALARVLYTLIGMPNIIMLLLIFGILTMFAGELAALRQNDIRRLLAYSSIGQMGMIMLAFGAFGVNSVFGGVLQAFTHGITKALLFLVLGVMALHTGGATDMESLRGFGRKFPYWSMLFAVGVLSTLGLPPFAGFWSKLVLIIGVIVDGHPTYAALALIATFIEVFYFARLLSVIYSSKLSPKLVERSIRNTTIPLLSATFLAAIIIAVGLHPNVFFDLGDSASRALLNRAYYIFSIIGHYLQSMGGV